MKDSDSIFTSTFIQHSILILPATDIIQYFCISIIPKMLGDAVWVYTGDEANIHHNLVSNIHIPTTNNGRTKTL